MIKNLRIPIVVVFTSLLFVACIKNTDFDQAENIAATPIVELDFVYFNVDASQFYNDSLSLPILTLRDTTEIPFLDDSEIQESLIMAEYYYRFTNSIPRDFTVDFQFLSETNDTTYATNTTVLAGNSQTPVITEFTDLIEGESILQLTQASKFVISITIPSANDSLTGSLNLQSKTTYYLEF